MRIADHAPVLQASQVLLQPSNLVHQQQVQAPMDAKILAALEAQQHATQVNDTTHTEGRTIQDRPGGRRFSRENGREGAEVAASEESEETRSSHVSPPGSGKLVDIVA